MVHLIQNRQRHIAIILCLVLIATVLSGCRRAEELSDVPGRGKWIDSDIYGAVQAEDGIRLQDDFAAAANKDILTSIEKDPDKDIQGPLVEVVNFVLGRYRETLSDGSIKGANAEAVRTLEELTFTWDKRNALGVEPLRKYVEDIQAISSISELTEYQGSRERNPFGLGLLMPWTVGAKQQFVDKSILYLSKPAYTLGGKEAYLTYTDSTLFENEKVDSLCLYILGRLGYSEKEIMDILKGNYNVETFIAINDCSDIYSTWETFEEVQSDREKLADHLNGYPLFEILDSRGFGGCDSFNVDYMYLKSLMEFYSEEHLEELKDFLMVHLILNVGYLLDRETLEKVMELNLSKTDKDARLIEPDDNLLFMWTLNRSRFRPAMDSLYLEKYYPDDNKISELEDSIGELIDSYRIMINEEEWLGEETKRAVIRKLDNMAVHVVRPDNEADYSKADIKGYSDGGNLLDAAAAGYRIMESHYAELSKNPLYDRFFWDIYDIEGSTTEVNCYYMADANAFYILAGWTAVADYIYGERATFEQFAGCVLTLAGHEISHGFDANGSLYDELGRQYDENRELIHWMDMGDKARLDEKAGKLANYFSLIRPLPSHGLVVGERVKNEAMADMGGVKAVLYMAKNRPDFDYDEFFRGYAALWAIQTTEKRELSSMSLDVHPLNYLRVNVILQQYDEFLSTYNIGPGDGMYLEPDKRVNVW